MTWRSATRTATSSPVGDARERVREDRLRRPGRGALPAPRTGRTDSGSGLLGGPSWAFVAVVFTIPLAIFFGVVGLVLASAARSRRAAWIAGGALIVLVLTTAALIAFTSEVSLG